MKNGNKISKEQLLGVIEDIIRTMPPRATIKQQDKPENAAWFGRVSAAIEGWNPYKTVLLGQCLGEFFSDLPWSSHALTRLEALVHEARHDLLLQIPGAGSVAVPCGGVFDYFDEIRKIIEFAKQDLLFVDPYLDAEFVSRYLPHVAAGVTTRLLTREKLPTLLPAVDTFTKQTGRTIEVRSAPNFHDRYVLVDRASCYQSGASFKDGAKSAPTTLTQIIDAFAALQNTYEGLWTSAQIKR